MERIFGPSSEKPFSAIIFYQRKKWPNRQYVKSTKINEGDLGTVVFTAALGRHRLIHLCQREGQES